MKNLKLCFFFLLSLFLLLPSLFFLPSPSSQLAFVSIVQNPDDGQIKKSSNNTELFHVLVNTFFGIKQIKAIEGEKEYTYPVDLLAAAITQLMLEQDKDVYKVDLDKIKDPPRQQLLNLLDAQGKLKHYQTLVWSGWNQLNDLGKIQEVQNIIKPYLLKMKVLGISKVVHPSSKLSFKFSKLGEISKSQLRYDFMQTFGLEYKKALAFSINKTWTPWLHVLQKARDFGLAHLTVEKEKVAVSSLVNSKAQEASDLSLVQLKIIQKLQVLTLPQLQTQVQAQIDPHLDAYKTSIQSTLENFINTEIKKIEIQWKSYNVDLLLKETNLKLTAAKLPQNAKTQLSVLFRNKIDSPKLDQSLLESYYLIIVDNLNALKANNISQVTINDKIYSLTELIKLINKDKSFFLLTARAQTELTTLAKNGITQTQLDTALTTILEVREAKATSSQTQKTQNQKKLIIGLSVGGGFLFLSTLGGFLYWFFKIKK